MDIRVLKYFLTVAREQSISGAAEALHMTQPPLSKQLKELEAELGKQLFIRGNRRITLTKEGMILRKRAEELVELMEKTKAEVISSDENISGDIYIGGGESEKMRLIAKTIKNTQMKHPHIRFHIFSGDAYDVIDKLDKGLIDFGILIEPIDFSKYDHLRLPDTDTWGILMRKDHPLASLPSLKPEHLLELPILTSRQMTKENGLSGWLGYDYDRLNIVSTGNLINTSTLMVEEGVGCALSFDGLVRLPADSTICFKPLEPVLQSNMFIIWKKYQVFSDASEKFMEMLHNEMKH